MQQNDIVKLQVAKQHNLFRILCTQFSDYVKSLRLVHLSEFVVYLITTSDEFYSFGDNSHFLLGVGDNIPRVEPQRVHSLCFKNIKHIEIQKEFRAVALTEDGKAFYWGSDVAPTQHVKDDDKLPKLIPQLVNRHVESVKIIGNEGIAIYNQNQLLYWSDTRIFHLNHLAQQIAAEPNISLFVNMNNEVVAVLNCQTVQTRIIVKLLRQKTVKKVLCTHQKGLILDSQGTVLLLDWTENSQGYVSQVLKLVIPNNEKAVDICAYKSSVMIQTQSNKTYELDIVSKTLVLKKTKNFEDHLVICKYPVTIHFDGRYGCERIFKMLKRKSIVDVIFGFASNR